MNNQEFIKQYNLLIIIAIIFIIIYIIFNVIDLIHSIKVMNINHENCINYWKQIGNIDFANYMCNKGVIKK
ncbi:hypothetical protein KAI04_04180 [Candidatus Pacearchaeota archaeon]|nr:hypothetical protein [Candidatus Pacearchaeota archaeon]